MLFDKIYSNHTPDPNFSEKICCIEKIKCSFEYFQSGVGTGNCLKPEKKFLPGLGKAEMLKETIEGFKELQNKTEEELKRMYI
jgi:hypothetical protein